MPKYTINYTSEAKDDILSLHNYISNELMVPDIADRYIDGILDKIYSLTFTADYFALSPRKFIQINYGPGARTIIYKKMTIVYNIIRNVVLIRRVIASSLVL
jgi:hypothetical protein